MKPLTKLFLIFFIGILIILVLYANLSDILNFFQPENLANVTLTPMRESNGTIKRVGGMLTKTLILPPDLEISVFAENLGKVRFLEKDGVGNIYATIPEQGKIVKFLDNNSDDKTDGTIVIADNLFYPHGFQFYNNELYIAVQDGIIRAQDNDSDGFYETKQQIVKDIPVGGNHITRSLRILNDKIYLSVGSSCNICLDEEKRAVILVYNLDGSHEEVCARGLRNSVGMIFVNNQLWATGMGADLLGEDFPPDEINLVECGNDYGWPECHGDNVEDPTYGTGRCSEKVKPSIALQAHSAPLGLRVAENFPYEGLFVAYHGSWNRKVPTGYKVVRITNFASQPVVEDFIIGWLDGQWGRPVDILFNNGKMYISDDKNGIVYVVNVSI
ncbi:PQQ-dependent sugar dehydrogenase [Candidatus Woesearchaeota archaeon]|nr:PQQ-dependent sugar dehydrogenase [Candidatus Woesearchaeota archaeon]